MVESQFAVSQTNYNTTLVVRISEQNSNEQIVRIVYTTKSKLNQQILPKKLSSYFKLRYSCQCLSDRYNIGRLLYCQFVVGWLLQPTLTFSTT